MLTIRLKRGGRKGHPQYRVVVQDSRFAPTSGRVVASVGTYNPHTKETNLDTDKIVTFLSNGAQPSDRVAVLLDKNGVALPSWVSLPKGSKSRTTRSVGKLRRNTPAEPEAPVEAEASAEEAAEEVPAPEAETNNEA